MDSRFPIVFVSWLLVVGAFDCSSRKDGVYASDPLGCTDVFWKCWDGQPFRYTCPSDLFFRQDAEYCDYKEKVPNCQKSPTARADDSELGGQLSDFDCTDRTDGFYLQQRVINRLYQCVDSRATTITTTVFVED